ncbi:MAG: L-threonine 3-dehydrogenase [Saprospiraceae bacterium]|nr:MAG: L-threonine 3-dehydrogenase [Saprospiraceae bacterium]
MKKETILIIGANGQIGSVLTETLRESLGRDKVIATDIKKPTEETGPFELLDILDKAQLHKLIRKYKVRQIYHLAAILSAKGEQNPKMAWDVNMVGLFNVLELAKEEKLKVFFPSSIAVFGSHTPQQNTPQETILQPETVYGISKVSGELWCQYYFNKYGVDVRSVRYPGIIGYQSMPGGGTTDYAVEIFHYAVQGIPYTCFLKSDTELPMLYMEDAIKATLEVMDCASDKLSVRTSYNLAGMSFTPAQLGDAIKKWIPQFELSYEPDFRQEIAEGWPGSIDDQVARKDWGWQPAFDLEKMTKDMIQKLGKKYRKENVFA